MIELLLMLVLYIVLFAFQDIIADHFGWYLSGPEKTYYVLTTILILAIGRMIF